MSNFNNFLRKYYFETHEYWQDMNDLKFANYFTTLLWLTFEST